MTKEKLFEELLTKRSAAAQGSSNEDRHLDWQKTGGLDEEQLKIGKSTLKLASSYTLGMANSNFFTDLNAVPLTTYRFDGRDLRSMVSGSK